MKLKGSLLLFIIILFVLPAPGQRYSDYVDPFIGTDHMGHTYPGATVPFGMVQLSPDTDTVPYSTGGPYNPRVYDYCAGYQYGDKTIVGFSHLHFSGTGHSDMGDILMMPANGSLKLNPGTADRPENGYRSRFSHADEEASPGYYSVLLQDHGIRAELTATGRVGVHRYTFNRADRPHIILDMAHGIYNYPGKNIWTFMRVENDSTVTGYRQTRGWARTRHVYFVIRFSKPITEYGYKDDQPVIYRGFYRKFNESLNFPEIAGKDVRAWFGFDVRPGEQIVARVAISPVSTVGAMKNLLAETPAADFDGIRQQAEAKWEKELSRVRIRADEATLKNFYTSLYHAYLSPTIYMDVDGKYRGIDQNNQLADGFVNYSTFSLWDTYRALHPLLTILQEKRTGDMVSSMLAHQEQSVHKALPVWSHQGNENWCMIGYHAVSVIADAALKGIKGFDRDRALQAMVASANFDGYDGIGDYRNYGYVPSDKHINAASKTLEYAYDDYCIMQMARLNGNNDVANEFRKRSESYQQIFDALTGFMRPKKSDGTFQEQFDPLKTEGQGFIEGNAWNYSLYVPHNVPELIRYAGGSGKFVRHLDELFDLPLDAEHIAESEDIDERGIIGRYVHGNEPGHHIPYLYVYAGQPWKTQYRIHQIMDEMYKPIPNGLPGNDDCGQMSAWYIFSALGFYPVCPGSNQYVIGSPCISGAEIALENGNTLKINVINGGSNRPYIRKITRNGRDYKRQFITHQDLMTGGDFTFTMSAKPNRGKISAQDLPGETY